MAEIAVMLTEDEIKGLRMAMIFGAPDPLPTTLKSVRAKLAAAQNAAERIGLGNAASSRNEAG